MVDAEQREAMSQRIPDDKVDQQEPLPLSGRLLLMRAQWINLFPTQRDVLVLCVAQAELLERELAERDAELFRYREEEADRDRRAESIAPSSTALAPVADWYREHTEAEMRREYESATDHDAPDHIRGESFEKWAEAEGYLRGDALRTLFAPSATGAASGDAARWQFLMELLDCDESEPLLSRLFDADSTEWPELVDAAIRARNDIRGQD